MKYLTPYHEFCDQIFSRSYRLGFQEFYARMGNLNCISETDAQLSNWLAHKLDVVHCINGFIGEIYELDEHLLAIECGDFDNPSEGQAILQEARHELGDLCYYQAQLQTLLINSPHKPNLVTWNNSFELQLNNMNVFQFNEIVDNMASWENLVPKKIEHMLNKTKKLIFYGHEGSLTQVLNDMCLILNGYRVYHLDYDIVSSVSDWLTLSNYQQMNMDKLRVRHPSGKFTPEAAEAKADQA